LLLLLFHAPRGNQLDGLTLMQRKRQSYVSVKSTSGGISDVRISARGLTGFGHMYHRSSPRDVAKIKLAGCTGWRVDRGSGGDRQEGGRYTTEPPLLTLSLGVNCRLSSIRKPVVHQNASSICSLFLMRPLSYSGQLACRARVWTCRRPE